MTKQCIICGCEFETKRTNRVTCGDPDCQYVRNLEYMRKYAHRHKDLHRGYNRLWMRQYRAEQKAEKKAKEEAREAVHADGYAERQRQKTLAMAGRVEL